MQLNACCQPSGYCGGVIPPVVSAVLHESPDDRCLGYGELASLYFFHDVPADPRQSCTYPVGSDAGAEDAAVPAARDSGVDAKPPMDGSSD
jgi:hypothetical protein